MGRGLLMRDKVAVLAVVAAVGFGAVGCAKKGESSLQNVDQPGTDSLVEPDPERDRAGAATSSASAATTSAATTAAAAATTTSAATPPPPPPPPPHRRRLLNRTCGG